MLPYKVRTQGTVEALGAGENCPVCVYAMVGSIFRARPTFGEKTPQTQVDEFCNTEGDPNAFSTWDIFNMQVILQYKDAQLAREAMCGILNSV